MIVNSLSLKIKTPIKYEMFIGVTDRDEIFFSVFIGRTILKLTWT